MIRKIAIRNYRMFREFELTFSPGINMLVGKNDSGKSTLIEAIGLALTGRVNGRSLGQELSPYLINLEATLEYVENLRAGKPAKPPDLIIELYLDEAEDTEILRGSNNLFGEDACGVRIQAIFSQDFADEYATFAKDTEAVRLAPTEYYKVEWLGFSGSFVSSRSVPVTTSTIDASTIRLQPGADHHLQEIIKAQLASNERVELSRQYRSLREEFGNKAPVKKINDRLAAEGSLTERKLSLGIDISQRYTWESSLITHLDDLPFTFIGRGDQSAIKTLMAIGRDADKAHVVLLEEPETHLSHTSLRKLIRRIEERCQGKQLLVATHSTYVLNKLGIENLILLNGGSATRIADVPKETKDYFKKLAGFDTLRLVLAERAILVEGPSDELVIQRAYRDAKGKLPIEDGIDVISVGLSHKRFLDLAVRLGRAVHIVTDNDGRAVEDVKSRFTDYLSKAFVSFHCENDTDLRTLEPSIVAANDIDTLNKVLETKCTTKEQLTEWMLSDKTRSALKIFESETRIQMPEYIKSVFNW